jgi:sugar transferase (PEP-CTERM system associated)
MYRIFNHYIPKTLLMLGAAETLILLVSVYLGVAIRFSEAGFGLVSTHDFFDQPLFPRALLFAGVMLTAMIAMGLYQRDLRDGTRGVLLRVSLAFFLGVALMSLVFYLLPTLYLGRGVLAISIVCAYAGIMTCRFLCFHHTDTRMKRRVLILGVGHKASQIEYLRRRTDRRGIEILGFVDLGDDQHVVDAQKVLSLESIPLKEFVFENGIDEIVVALDDRRRKIPIDDVLECKMRGVNVIDSATFFERQLGKMKLDSLHPSSVVFSDGFSQAAMRSSAKRLFDIVVSTVMLLMAAPIMLVTAVAILAESGFRGPIIYRQQRVGVDNRPFEVLKFRSMRVDAEKEGQAQWAQKNDARVTKVGAFIRKTRIDELPQLINVLRGDMSFVGPRPERPQFVSELSEVIPFYGLRHHVKPGITGWAQICYPYGSSVADAKEKLQYDLYYMKNYSLFLDMMILFQTAQVILWGKGAR